MHIQLLDLLNTTKLQADLKGHMAAADERSVTPMPITLVVRPPSKTLAEPTVNTFLVTLGFVLHPLEILYCKRDFSL